MCSFGHSEGVAGLHLGGPPLRKCPFQVQNVFVFVFVFVFAFVFAFGRPSSTQMFFSGGANILFN